MIDYLVRTAEPGEYASAGRVAAAGYLADGLLRRSDGNVDERYRGMLLDAERRAREAELLVAVAGADVLGTVTWCPPGTGWREVARQADQGEFRMLSVAPQARGRGVGKALADACLDRARAGELAEVVIASLPQMLVAHAVYAGLGFVRAPELDFTPVPLVDLWGFRLRLCC